ncbi:two-component system sensor histidine kinase NarQ [Serratia marcescens]|uniref:Sensor protein n=1 Tax=Serratia marcescens TaxID=615 RepID=A0A1Q4NYB1_SERMA|nr:nitrate/nitrite two-component system sensor histidine kinase NarQ [Serratia marcescens]OKB65866.1 two-component system sensor histidine kinase NarQ [Serratia marcescens]
MLVKRSVTGSLARALFGIVILSVLATGLALTTVAGSQNDAEAINIAGSLRMQSYRLAFDLDQQSAELELHLQQYRQSLQAPVLQKLARFYVPSEVRNHYLALQQTWQTMEQQIRSGQAAAYRAEVAGYVNRVDHFVSALQRYSELKLTLVAAISVLGYAAIIGLVLFCIRFMRRQVVAPLQHLVDASQRVQQRNFSHPQLDVALPNELGVLSQTFSAMSDELARLYQSLELKVQEKTRRLQQANETLEVLYRCSQALSVRQIDPQAFENILRIVRQSERLRCIQLSVADNRWQLSEGEAAPTQPWSALPITQGDKPLGELRWQPEAHPPHPHLMQSLANMLGRGVYFNRAQKQHQYLLLMEERATIARELHDSLAQALSFLRIQLTLLRRAADDPAAQTIIDDFDRTLADAYRQLRELLATFRLNIQEADLNAALEQLLQPLKALTAARIQLHCRLSSQALNAQQQVHALQIVREAVLNAVKHAGANEIAVCCEVNAAGDNVFSITDDGCGIASLEEPEGHYGLTIMSERAARLGGTLCIQRRSAGGTAVCLTFPP